MGGLPSMSAAHGSCPASIGATVLYAPTHAASVVQELAGLVTAGSKSRRATTPHPETRAPVVVRQSGGSLLPGTGASDFQVIPCVACGA